MRAPDLDDVRPRLCFRIERFVQMAQRRQQPMLDLLRTSDVHGRRIGIVRRLAHVDVVVGVHRLLGAEHAPQHLDRPVRDDLVGVHVRLRAGARLPHGQRKVLVELALAHFLRGRGDGFAELRVEPAERHVHVGSCALDDAERAHDRLGLLLPADLEIAERALRLGAPIFIGRHLDGAEAVRLHADLGRASRICRSHGWSSPTPKARQFAAPLAWQQRWLQRFASVSMAVIPHDIART